MADASDVCPRCHVRWDDHREFVLRGWPVPLCPDEIELLKQGRDPFERFHDQGEGVRDEGELPDEDLGTERSDVEDANGSDE